MEDPMMNRSLRILFFGYHGVGVESLRRLRQAGHQIVACFTAPPHAAWVPDVAADCQKAAITCIDVEPHPSQADRFREHRPDLIVSAGYTGRITLPFLALPTLGSINAHLAPLPAYRGISPIPWGIARLETSWAITVHKMTHNYSEGAILRERPVLMKPYCNAYDLLTACSIEAAGALTDTVNEIAAGIENASLQDLRAGVRFFDGSVPHGGVIDWHQPASHLASFVRAIDCGRFATDGRYEHLTAPASAVLNGMPLGIWRARAGGTVSNYSPGTITRCDGELWIQTGRGHLVIDQLVDAAGTDWTANDYIAKHDLKAGDTFETPHRWQDQETPILNHAA
jgi:methionyl-tRNA formyltransferase